MAPLILVTHTPSAGSARAEAAALAVAASLVGSGERAALLIDAAGSHTWRDTILAGDAARRLARGLELGAAEALEQGSAVVRVRGRIAIAATSPDVEKTLALIEGSEDCGQQRVANVVPAQFQAVLGAVAAGTASVLLRCASGPDAALAGALSIELRRRGIRHKVWVGGLGAIGGARARAGLEPGGRDGERAARLLGALGDGPGPELRPPAGLLKRRLRLGSESGQALPALVGMLAAVAALALALVALGGAATAKGRAQRAVDLAAVSAARSMRDDFNRLFVPALRPDGRPDPLHLSRERYLERARRAAREGAARNGLDPGTVRVSFPEGESFGPLRVEVGARAPIAVEGSEPDRPTRHVRVAATAVAQLGAGATGTSAYPRVATGGGYSGPLAYRQGEPMRPDAAAAFDRLARSAAAAGHALTINSAFRSDAEQAELFAANPDPRWVAPPGRSLHRCGTELDLGPPSAYGWLAGNARRFGFLRRYDWEPWHFGFVAGPAPCAAEVAGQGGASGAHGPASSRRGADGRAAGARGLPGFVPGFARRPLLEAASRHDVSAALLAAQLLAESNFNPAAVSPAGARGIAQFMPATAAAYGLDDPFDPAAAIDAQARLMSDLLDRFGSPALALAAYNAGPGAVSACGCVPPYAETQAYVARILGILDGAGQMPIAGAPPLEVRLLE